jgi:integrase/recombinase XerD
MLNDVALLDEKDPRQRFERNPAFLHIQGLASNESKRTVSSFAARFVRHWNAMSDTPFLPDYLAALSSRNLTDDQKSMITDRNIQTAILAPWRTLTNGIVLAVMERIRVSIVGNSKDPMNPSTYNSYLAVIKGIARKAYLAKLIPADEFNLIADNRAIKYTREKGSGVLIDEVQEVVDMCLQEGTRAGLRDALLFLILFGCGPRRSEVVGIDLKDVDLIRGRIVVTGKGNKRRYLRLQPYTLDVLMDWLSEAEITDGSLFRRIARGDHVAKSGAARSPRITPSGIYDIVKRRMLANPKITRGISPHSFRRGLITFLHRKGADIATISELVGHESVDTTKRYITDLEEQFDSASQLVNFGE